MHAITTGLGQLFFATRNNPNWTSSTTALYQGVFADFFVVTFLFLSLLWLSGRCHPVPSHPVRKLMMAKIKIRRHQNALREENENQREKRNEVITKRNVFLVFTACCKSCETAKSLDQRNPVCKGWSRKNSKWCKCTSWMKENKKRFVSRLGPYSRVTVFFTLEGFAFSLRVFFFFFSDSVRLCNKSRIEIGHDGAICGEVLTVDLDWHMMASHLTRHCWKAELKSMCPFYFCSTVLDDTLPSSLHCFSALKNGTAVARTDM